MIQIRRGRCPEKLRGSPRNGTHYNKPAVVKALWDMQHGKCCYCEQTIPSEGHAKAVEHFHPKSVFKGKKNDWPNLLLACAQCNGKKSNRFPEELTGDSGQPKVLYQKRDGQRRPLIIDPSDGVTDPEDHIGFGVDDGDIAALGIPHEKDGSRLGRVTIDTVGLEGSYYTKERRSFYREVLYPRYLALLAAMDAGHQDQLDTSRHAFRELLSARGRFAAFARAFAERKQVSEHFNIQIPACAET